MSALWPGPTWHTGIGEHNAESSGAPQSPVGQLCCLGRLQGFPAGTAQFRDLAIHPLAASLHQLQPLAALPQECCCATPCLYCPGHTCTLCTVVLRCTLVPQQWSSFDARRLSCSVRRWRSLPRRSPRRRSRPRRSPPACPRAPCARGCAWRLGRRAPWLAPSRACCVRRACSWHPRQHRRCRPLQV